MKLTKTIAVIADIHSNHFALEAVLEYAKEQKVDEYLFLGDYVSDYSCPQKTMEILYRLQEEAPCTFLRGNREDYLIDYHKSLKTEAPIVWLENSSSGSLLYTYRNLTPKDIAFFESMPITKRMEWEGLPPIEAAHGSPERSNELLLFDTDRTREVLCKMQGSLLVNAHTHIQGSYEYHGKRLINTGACGSPMYLPKQAPFVILRGNEEGWEAEFCRISYDLKPLWKEMEESGLFEIAPGWSRVSMMLVITGVNRSAPCVNLAAKLCQERTGRWCDWPYIPEKDWEEAMRQLEVPTLVRLQNEIC